MLAELKFPSPNLLIRFALTANPTLKMQGTLEKLRNRFFRQGSGPTRRPCWRHHSASSFPTMQQPPVITLSSSCLSWLSSSSRMEDPWQSAYDCAVKVARKAGEVSEGASFPPTTPQFFFFFPALDSNQAAPAGHQRGRRERNKGLNQELHRGPGDKDWREGRENHHGRAEERVWWIYPQVRQQGSFLWVSHRI